MAGPLRWFPFEIDEFETDGAVKLMTNEQLGVFVRLLVWQWREGFVPDDARGLARSFNARLADVRRVLGLKFVSDGTKSKRLVNLKLAQVYAQQLDKSEKARKAGQHSANKRRAFAQQALERTSGKRPDFVAPEVDVRSEIKKSLRIASGEATA